MGIESERIPNLSDLSPHAEEGKPLLEQLHDRQREIDGESNVIEENKQLRRVNEGLLIDLKNTKTLNRREFTGKGFRLLALGTIAAGFGAGFELTKDILDVPSYPSFPSEPQYSTPQIDTPIPNTAQEHPDTEGDILPGGFRIVGDGIEIKLSELTTHIDEIQQSSHSTEESQELPSSYTFRLLSEVSHGVTPKILLSNGTLHASDALVSGRGGENPYVRLEILPSDSSPTGPDAQLIVDQKYKDGTTKSEVLSTIDFPTFHYSPQDSNVSMYSSKKITDEEINNVYPTVKSAADFIGTSLTAKIYKVPSAAFNDITAIPDHILRMAGNDAVIPGFLESKDESFMEIVNYFETARGAIKTIANDPHFIGEKGQQLNSILKKYEEYAKTTISSVYSSSDSSHMSQTMIQGVIDANPLFSLFNIKQYLQTNSKYLFGNINNNSIDMVANALTVWNFWGDEFMDRTTIAGNDISPQAEVNSEINAFSKDILSLLETINPDPDAQRRFVKKINSIKV